MYFFYICILTNNCKTMKKKIMNVCGVALLAVSLLACSGQKKGMAATEMASDSTKVVGDVSASKQIVQDILSEGRGWPLILRLH